MVYDSVTFGGIDGQNSIHARDHFVVIHGDVVNWRVHEIYRIMRSSRRIRADMGSDDNVTGQHIAFALHFSQLKSRADRRDGAIGVRHHANARWARTDAAQTTDNSQRWRTAAADFTVATRQRDFHKISAAFRAISAV